MLFGDKLTQLIEERGTNQTRLARATGIGQTTISNLATGKQRPYMDQALTLAKALGVSLDYLADDVKDVEEDPDGGLSDEDRTLLRVFRALELSLDEALRRLAGPGASTGESGDSDRDRKKSG